MWEAGRAPGSKSQNTGGASVWERNSLAFSGVVNSQICPYWVSTICHSQFRSSFPTTGSYSGFCLYASALVSHYSLYSPVFSLQPWGQQFDLWSPLSFGYKKSCWFFSLFIFLLFLRTEWWLPNSLLTPYRNCSNPYSDFLLSTSLAAPGQQYWCQSS